MRTRTSRTVSGRAVPEGSWPAGNDSYDYLRPLFVLRLNYLRLKCSSGFPQRRENMEILENENGHGKVMGVLPWDLPNLCSFGDSENHFHKMS